MQAKRAGFASVLFASLVLMAGCEKRDEQQWSRLLAEGETLEREIGNVSSDMASLQLVKFGGPGWRVCGQAQSELGDTGVELVRLGHELSQWSTYVEEFARTGGSERVRLEASADLGGMEETLAYWKTRVARVEGKLQFLGCVP